MPLKPSRNEEEHFAKVEADRLKARKAAAAAEAEKAARQLHYMKCPKCGADLLTELYHKVQVDRCPDCKGIWFDAGEAESIVEQNEQKGVAGLFQAIVHGVRGPGRSSIKTSE
jgi:hypothetical protein